MPWVRTHRGREGLCVRGQSSGSSAYQPMSPITTGTYEENGCSTFSSFVQNMWKKKMQNGNGGKHFLLMFYSNRFLNAQNMKGSSIPVCPESSTACVPWPHGPNPSVFWGHWSGPKGSEVLSHNAVYLEQDALNPPRCLMMSLKDSQQHIGIIRAA